MAPCTKTHPVDSAHLYTASHGQVLSRSSAVSMFSKCEPNYRRTTFDVCSGCYTHHSSAQLPRITSPLFHASVVLQMLKLKFSAKIKYTSVVNHFPNIQYFNNVTTFYNGDAIFKKRGEATRLLRNLVRKAERPIARSLNG